MTLNRDNKFRLSALRAAIEPVAAAERLASLTRQHGIAQADLAAAQYRVDNIVPILQARLDALEAIPATYDDSTAAAYVAAMDVYLALPGAHQAWLTADRRATVASATKQIAAVNASTTAAQAVVDGAAAAITREQANQTALASALTALEAEIAS